MRVGTDWKKFTAGHRIPWHEKCGRMHGHTWRVRVEVEGSIDKARGMVVDFGEISKAVDEIIAPLDHRFLAAQSAVLVESHLYVEKPTTVVMIGPSYLIDEKYVLPKEDVIVLPMSIVSAENLVGYFLDKLVMYQWAANKRVTVQVSESGDNIAQDSRLGQVNNIFPSTLVMGTTSTASNEWFSSNALTNWAQSVVDLQFEFEK